MPFGVGSALEQPATITSSAAAPASPILVRNRPATGNVSSINSASRNTPNCCVETGGVFLEAGGSTRLCVVTVTVPVAPDAVAFTAVPGAVHPPCGIADVQESVTAPVNPPTPVTVTVIVPLLPAVTVGDDALSVKSHAVPLTASVCGLPVALSAMESVAERVPLAPAGGVKVIMTTQVALAARVAPLVHVVPVATAKSDPFVPVKPGVAVMFSVELPVFFTVTVCAALVVVTSCPLKLIGVDGVSVTTGAEATPVPVKDSVCGLPVPLSVRVSVAERAPAALGVKVMLIVQVPFGTTGVVVVQVVPLATANSVPPVDGASVKVRLMFPVFVTVTGSAVLVVPTG